MNKIKIIIPSIIILIIFLCSFNKITFLIDLTKISLLSDKYREKKLELLAKNYLKSKKLDFLINRYSKNEIFLSFICKEAIKKNKNINLKKRYESLIPLIIEKFPENVFIDHLDFYAEKDSSKELQNFDTLFFKFLADSELNSFSCNLLKDANRNKIISEQSLFYLIYYLNWQKNFSLSEDLLNWRLKEKKINKDRYDFLFNDLYSRKNIKREGKINERTIKDNLKKLFEKKDLQIDLNNNLILDGDFKEKDSLNKYWVFSDMSNTGPFSKGSFYGNIDFAENYNMRVMGFFTKKIPGKEFSRGGFWYKDEIPLKKKLYLFCFQYKTFKGTETPSFWLANELKEELKLPPTDLKWKEVFYIFNNDKLKMPKIKPLLRIWGVGSVWFDKIYFSEIKLKGDSVEKDVLFIQ